MRPSTKGLAHQNVSSWGKGSGKSARFRQMECDHAVRRAARSQKMAKELIAEAQRDGVISNEHADVLLAELSIR